ARGKNQRPRQAARIRTCDKRRGRVGSIAPGRRALFGIGLEGRAHRGSQGGLPMVHHDRATPIRVLIAEDIPRVRAALVTFLSAHPDFQIVGEAGDEAAALQLARAHEPTVALVDVLLPDADDGLALLRALTWELGIPAVAISIHSGVGSRA